MNRTVPILVLAATLTAGGPAAAAASFVNGITVPGSLLDLSGTTVNDGRLGMFSDLYYDPSRNEWWGLSDRGPGGGTLSYETRVQRFTIDVNPLSGAISNFQVAQTIKFSGLGGPLNGQAPSASGVLGRAFDPEGFVVNPVSGNFLVSDEYGASLYEFNRSGALLRQYAMPANLTPRVGSTVDYNALPVPAVVGDPQLSAGREPNRGLEGLAISPDGRYAYAMLQNGTIQDGWSGAGGGTRGLYTRIVKFDTASGTAVGQFAYRLDSSGQGRGISSIVALGNEKFLVLERNNRGVGSASNLASPDKNVFLVDLNGASDVSSINLPASGALPSGMVAVAKGAKLIDLDADTLAALGNRSPEKWEGLAIGPQLQDGSFMLLAGTDNDYSVSQIPGSSTQYDVYFNPATGARLQCDLGATSNCFSIAADGTLGSTNLGELPGGYVLIPGVLHAYKASLADLGGAYTAPVPEPGSWAMMLGGLLALGATARRKRG